MILFPALWSVYRSHTYEEAYHFYGDQIRQAGSRSQTEDHVRLHLLEKWYWAYIDWKIWDFTTHPKDPDGVLPHLSENGEIVPDTYYIRAATFYAIIERDIVNRRLYLSLLYRKADRNTWIEKLVAEPDKYWEPQS